MRPARDREGILSAVKGAAREARYQQSSAAQACSSAGNFSGDNKLLDKNWISRSPFSEIKAN
jgi:hypothetical protein